MYFVTDLVAVIVGMVVINIVALTVVVTLIVFVHTSLTVGVLGLQLLLLLFVYFSSVVNVQLLKQK